MCIDLSLAVPPAPQLVLSTLPCLEDEAEEVQEAASAVLLEMASYLEPADLQRHIIEYLRYEAFG